MGKRDTRVDAYIAKSAEFAQPILTKIRESVHEQCTDVEETLKWGMPTFMYHGILCNMAAFKAHTSFGFWKGSLVTGDPADVNAMGQFGRMTKISDFPSKKDFARFMKRAMELNAASVKVERPRKNPPKEIPSIPDYFMAAIKKNKKALAGYEKLSPSHQREYVEWITDAKGEDTRARRVAQAVEWMAEGKSRNWKYERR
jgi:uncharacterized protein YdeI (YjbR/CyaY-like superfamily)